MNIIVLIKEVPDMQMVKFDRERGVVNRASASAEINPFDLNALQAGLEIKKQTNGTMTVITMGPKTAEKSLRECICQRRRSCHSAFGQEIRRGRYAGDLFYLVLRCQKIRRF